MGGGRPDALLAAVEWLRDLLLGGVASSVAVIAVAGVGLLMLTGRVQLRRALGVVIGCFILFSAATIASGLTGVALAEPEEPPVPVAVAPPVYTPVPPRPPAFDPYAGASVPSTR